MIITTNILALPLVLVVYLIDSYCLLFAGRFVACRLDPGGKVAKALFEVTEPVLAWAGRMARRVTSRTVSPGILACLLVLAGLFIRQATIGLLR